MDTRVMADQIRDMGGHEFADPQDVHDTLAGMGELMRAMQETMNGWGLSLAEAGVHQAYPEVVQEVAGQMNGLADQLDEALAGGVMRGPGR